MVHRDPPRFILNYIPGSSKPKLTSIRGGTSFWVTAGRAGVRSSMLTVLVTFPPEEVPERRNVVGTPAARHPRDDGHVQPFRDRFSRYEEGNTEMGGILKRLVFDGDTAQTELVGPPNLDRQAAAAGARAKTPQSDPDKMAIAELEAREDVRLPMTIHRNRAGRPATVDLRRQLHSPRRTRVGASGSISTSTSTLIVRVHGMAQLYLIGACQELSLYISLVNWKAD